MIQVAGGSRNRIALTALPDNVREGIGRMNEAIKRPLLQKAGTGGEQNHATILPLEPRISINVLRRKARDCKACDLWRHATQTVFGEGPAKATVMFVGEQPGGSGRSHRSSLCWTRGETAE